MKKYYIQFSTDFHLLAALASIEDLSRSDIVLVGPRTKMSSLLAEKISAEFVDADPRSPKVSLWRLLRLMFGAKVCRDGVIISPFVFPFYVFLRLLEEGVMVKSIVRTDEGVGSYASVGHYYASLKLENPGRTKIHCAVKAFVKKASVWMTRSLRICREKYMFKRDLSVDRGGVERLMGNIDLLGRLDGLNGKTLYVSQPGVSETFGTPEDYAGFLKGLGGRIGLGEIVVKRHPADKFDYASHGFDVVEGFPLELYHVEDSVVIGFSSTALLMAKIMGGCKRVYFLKMQGAGPFYDGLSPMNKRLFDFYLEPLDCAGIRSGESSCRRGSEARDI